MACCTSLTPLAKQATTSRAPLASHVLLVNTIPLLAARPLLLASRALLAPTIPLQAKLLAKSVLLAPTIPLLAAHLLRLVSRVQATLTRCKALPLALLRVQAARPCRLALHVHAAKLATTPRAVRVSFVLQVA